MKSEIAFEKKYLILWHFCNFLIYRFSSSSFVAVCLTKGFSSEQSLTVNEKRKEILSYGLCRLCFCLFIVLIVYNLFYRLNAC